MDNPFTFIGILIVFAAMLFLAYVTTRYIGGKASKALKGKFITIIDTVSIGIDKHLHLVKVGEEYLLIASAGKSVEFLAQVGMNDVNMEEITENNSVFDFKNLFDKYLQALKVSGKKESKEEKSNLDSTMEGELFKSNLKKLKTLNLRTNDQENNDGDESTNEK
ncbi:MAG: flagellar biosynthetic protein FliO [Clostridia bacterium]|nr:flagellar biosynthetic protein FliO [Clostridia bacterium]